MDKNRIEGRHGASRGHNTPKTTGMSVEVNSAAVWWSNVQLPGEISRASAPEKSAEVIVVGKTCRGCDARSNNDTGGDFRRGRWRLAARRRKHGLRRDAAATVGARIHLPRGGERAVFPAFLSRVVGFADRSVRAFYKKGFPARSSPSVVAGPWPGSRMVESGRGVRAPFKRLNAC